MFYSSIGDVIIVLVDLFPPWHVTLGRPFCVKKTMEHEVLNGESMSIVVSECMVCSIKQLLA